MPDTLSMRNRGCSTRRKPTRKDGPKSELRRMYRGQRRVIRRRRQLMNAVRKLLHKNGLLKNANSDALAFTRKKDPWVKRHLAHERLLTPYELAVALGHIARHRGFKSNANRAGRMRRDFEDEEAWQKRKRGWPDGLSGSSWRPTRKPINASVTARATTHIRRSHRSQKRK